MPLIFNFETQETIGLSDYLDYVAEHVNPKDFDSVAESAEYLRKLGNNRKFAVDLLNKQLQLWPKNALGFYSVQSNLLGVKGDFSVRLNVWPLLSPDHRRKTLESNIYSYYDTHDHNFTFMTVGYFGPGYGTQLYEYDSEKIIGYIGEKVDLEPLGNTTLPVGKVMLYRPFRDIHTQLPPPEYSMSLNLLVSDRETASLRHQYYFDVDKSIIDSYVESYSTRRVSMVDLVACLGDANTVEPLWRLALKHPCNRTRLEAYRAICRIQPNEAERVVSALSADRDPLIQQGAATLALV